MSYYRTFLNRYNLFDGNIPGNDFQNPVSIEGVLGYNNAIQLTQPMHMQDLKYFRDPLYSYGDWVSSGETSKCTAFTDNPGNTANWNNTYEQYIAREGWNAYKVHGGQKAILRNFAKYAECDIKGQLAKYDANNNYLIAYSSGALTGNDADAVALAYYNSASQERTETAFWYSGARAAAEAYTLLGDLSKADEMNAIADNIRTAILTLLWDDGPINDGPGEPTGEIGRVPGTLRQRRPPRRRRPRVRDDAREHPRRRQRLHGRDLGQPGVDLDVVADLRLRHRHHVKHVLDDQRRVRPALRHHHRRRRSRAADQPHDAGPAAAEPVDARRGHALGQHRHAVHQRPGRSARTRT